MNATLHFQRGPLLALVAVFFLALMAALAPGLSEVDLNTFSGGGPGGPEVTSSAAPGAEQAPVWVSDPLQPPLAGIERMAVGR
ncbi:MAG TPA: hypothetical protein VG126_05050 [Thermoleophilaceae bacterium]|nr:hypothetical protein [Thermoleophilaceae bacterium]